MPRSLDLSDIELKVALLLVEDRLKSPGQKATMGTEEHKVLLSLSTKITGLVRTKAALAQTILVPPSASGRSLSAHPAPRPQAPSTAPTPRVPEEPNEATTPGGCVFCGSLLTDHGAHGFCCAQCAEAEEGAL